MCYYGDQVKGNKIGGVLTCVGEKVEFFFFFCGRSEGKRQCRRTETRLECDNYGSSLLWLYRACDSNVVT